jgi:hypothetical protein
VLVLGNEIEEDSLFETNILGLEMTSAHATAVTSLFIQVFQSLPKEK